MRKQLYFVAVLLVATACDDDDSFHEDAESSQDSSFEDSAVADSTTEDATSGDSSVPYSPAYQPGTVIFRERPGKFSNAPAAGSRLSVGDFDGDGYADLAVRQSGNTPDILGEPPVRQAWLLHNDFGMLGDDIEGDKQDLPAFSDVSESSGFLAVRGQYPIPIGRPIDIVTFGDIDNDGDLDIYTGIDASSAVSVTVDGQTISVKETCELLINDGSGHFELTSTNDPIRKPTNPGGAAFTDFNLDGNLDLWLPQYDGQDVLFQGNRRGEFTNVTAQQGLTTLEWEEIASLNAALAHSVAWSAAACDLNNDGYPELLAASYGRAPNHLWQGGETFTNRSVDSGYAYDDNTTWTDNQFARCYCQAHREAEDCANVPDPLISCSDNWNHSNDRELFRLGGNSAATICADFDGDGFLDLFTTEIKHWWAGEGSDASEVLVNTGESDVRFIRPGRDATGLAMPHDTADWDEGHMTATAFDFDNDGKPDLYLGASDYAGNRGHLYRNVSEAGAIRFEELPISDFFEHNRSHGVVVADFDRDGDLDIIVGHSLARCDAHSPNNCYATNQVRYFENVIGQNAHWFQLDLQGGQGTNRLAVGAKVFVKSATTQQSQEISGGYGHYGAQNDRILHFGLGPDTEAEVTVTWPNAARDTETFTLKADKRYKLIQGQTPTVVP